MHTGRFVFSELIAHLPHQEFQKCVARYDDHPQPRKLSYWDQYLAMAFAELTSRETLRDMEACLRSVTGKLYHLGFRGTVARSTLADANETRDWRIFAEFAHVLIKIARPLYADEPLGVDLDHSLYALDSTTIDLCLSLFPWAKFRRHKAAVKMHTLLDLPGNIPTFISITDGKVHDVNILDEIFPEAGAFYVMDRGYVDFERLLPLHPQFGLLRRAHQIQHSDPAPLLASGGQGHRRSLRSHCYFDGHQFGEGVPGCATARELSGCGNQKEVQVPHQQLRPAGTYHRQDLQVPLAGGTLFQVDQAAPADQSFLRHQRERGEDANLDCGLGLRLGGRPPQAPGPGGKPLPDSTDFEPDAFRENAHSTGTSSVGLRERLRRFRQPVDSVRLLAGH